MGWKDANPVFGMPKRASNLVTARSAELACNVPSPTYRNCHHGMVLLNKAGQSTVGIFSRLLEPGFTLLTFWCIVLEASQLQGVR